MSQSIGVNPHKDHLRYVAGKGYQVQITLPNELREVVAAVAGKPKAIAQLTEYIKDKTLPAPSRDENGKLVYPPAAIRAGAPIDAKFIGWIEAARRALIPPRVVILHRTAPGLPAPWLRYWHQECLAKLDGPEIGMSDDDAREALRSIRSPSMIDVTPTTVVLSLDQALKDWKAVHAKNYGAWRDQKAEDKAEKAKRLAAESLFAHAGTRDFAAIKTVKLQGWVDQLDDGQAYYYGNDVKALYSALYQKNRFGEGVANPGEKLFIPAKPDGDTRLPLSDKDAARVLEDARQQEPAVRWGQWCAAYTGFITSEMFVAKASEITEIDGVPVWDCRGRKLKSAYRPRVEPLHPALVAEGFLDYARSRGDGMLFDISPTQASAALNAHIRSLGIMGKEHVHYSWRHDFTSQLDRFPDKVSAALARVLTGHRAPDVHEHNYIHKHIHEMYDAVKLITYPLIDKLAAAA